MDDLVTTSCFFYAGVFAALQGLVMRLHCWWLLMDKLGLRLVVVHMRSVTVAD